MPAKSEMTLLRDLIEIPERVHQSDFVLRLTEGVRDPGRTLASYVVTDQLVRCFDEALGIIEKAVSSGVSKAVYLNGSFGSGKSHFMAVLDLLLEGDPRALDPGAGRGGGQAQWLDPGPALPAGALPYDRRGGPGVGHPGWLCRACPSPASAGAGTGFLCRRASLQGC